MGEFRAIEKLLFCPLETYSPDKHTHLITATKVELLPKAFKRKLHVRLSLTHRTRSRTAPFCLFWDII